MLTVEQVGADALAEYGAIPMDTLIDSVLHVEVLDRGFGGFRLEERPVRPPWRKVHNANGEEPATDWPRRWDISNWGIFVARLDGRPVGGATVAARTEGVCMLDGRSDLGVLWDIRVHPDHQRQGVGRALFTAAVDWSRGQGLRQLKIETQNNNVGACRFYAAMGCELRGIVHHAYAASPEWADEVMFLWWLEL